MPSADSNDWVLANLKHSGYYRVNYDLNNWIKLRDQLNSDHEKIHFINRAQLIDDSFNLGRAGHLTQELFLSLVKYLSNEKESLPFTAAQSGLNYISNQVSANYETYNQFKKYYLSLMESTYNRLAWIETIEEITEVFV